MKMQVHVDYLEPGRAGADRVKDAVALVASGIDTGVCQPQLAELVALAEICDTYHLHPEAARVRRWMGER